MGYHPSQKSQIRKQMTVAKYIQNRDMLLNTMFVIKPSGEGFFIFNGIEYTTTEFRRMFPMPVSLIAFNHGDSADGRRNWIQN